MSEVETFSLSHRRPLVIQPYIIDLMRVCISWSFLFRFERCMAQVLGNTPPSPHPDRPRHICHDETWSDQPTGAGMPSGTGLPRAQLERGLGLDLLCFTDLGIN